MPNTQYLLSIYHLQEALLANVPTPGEAGMFLYVQLK